MVGVNVNDADDVQKTSENDSEARENFEEDPLPHQQKESEEIEGSYSGPLG